MKEQHSDHPDTSRFFFQFLIIGVLFYVGSYYLLVRKQEKSINELWHLNAGPDSSPPISAGSQPLYLWKTSLLHTAFTPIHRLDRRIRREYWGRDGIVWEDADISKFQPR